MKWVFSSILLLPLFVFKFSCSNPVAITASDCIGEYSPSEILNHQYLDKEDEVGAYCLIESLIDTTITDCEFADRVFELSDRWGFMMCGIDCQDAGWLKLDRTRRMRIREIITIGCLTYRASPLFFNGIDPKSCDIEDLYQFCNATLIDSLQYRQALRIHLEEIYETCK